MSGRDVTSVRAKSISPEVLVAEGPMVRVSAHDIDVLKRKAAETERARVRLCAHPGVDDRLHEMFIVHQKGTYVRPHKHLNKSESAHIIDGSVTWVIFDDAGRVTDAIHMGGYGSGQAFYHRMSGPYYHTLLIHSDWLVFHETTTGPFDRADTVFAPWAPGNDDLAGQRAFIERVTSEVDKLAFGAR